MNLARVIGTVVATQKYEGLVGCKLLLVQPLDHAQRKAGDYLVAVDTVRAGFGELVYFVNSREAALALEPSFVPVDAAIVGIVDEVATDPLPAIDSEIFFHTGRPVAPGPAPRSATDSARGTAAATPVVTPIATAVAPTPVPAPAAAAATPVAAPIATAAASTLAPAPAAVKDATAQPAPGQPAQAPPAKAAPTKKAAGKPSRRRR